MSVRDVFVIVYKGFGICYDRLGKHCYDFKICYDGFAIVCNVFS